MWAAFVVAGLRRLNLIFLQGVEGEVFCSQAVVHDIIVEVGAGILIECLPRNVTDLDI